MVIEIFTRTLRPGIGRLATATLALILMGIQLMACSPVRAATIISTNITTTGNVGIGTASPTSPLSVTGASIGKALTILNQTGDQAVFSASVAGISKFIIDNSGNVGIGTISPGTLLDVKGIQRLSGATSGYATLSPAATNGSLSLYPSTDSTTAIQINKADGTTNVIAVDTSNGFLSVGGTGSPHTLGVQTGAGDGVLFETAFNAGQFLFFKPSTGMITSGRHGSASKTPLLLGVDQAEVIRISAAEDATKYNVGIQMPGGSNPVYQLDVRGTSPVIQVRPSVNTDFGYFVAANGSGNNLLAVENNTGGTLVGGSSAYSAVIGSGWANRDTHIIAGNLIRMTLNGVSGNVGIGVTGPGAKLEVNGGVRLNTVTAKPTCDSTQRGTQWFTQSGAGVKDAFEVCAKDAADVYAWRTLY